MRAPFMKSAAVAVVLALTTFAHAAELDAPGVAGRVSLAQGDVTLESREGGRGEATLNWPVTGGDILHTARGARTELRVGSTAVRLDGDSSMEVVRLDDETVRLRLFYGSVNVRVMNRELLDGFELTTPHGSVRMNQPGRIRVDAERDPQTTSLSVFEGVAVLSVPGSSLTVRQGRSAHSQAGDVFTGAAKRDGFDDWAYQRDLRDDRSQSTRYVTREMTGYEELDQHGIWRESVEYGPLWTPRAVPAGWVPYRDGRWTWVAPWGWTWVDNAPWGYAPSHYGRWVMVGSRWSWAPGRHISRPVWAPALVGWVGGSNWSLSFGTGGHHYMPAQGWYPLTPYDMFVPHYRARHDHLSRINHGLRPRRDRHHDHRRGHRPPGLTVVPQEHFGIRNVIEVSKMPKTAAPVAVLPGAGAAPPPPQLRPGSTALDERRRARREYMDRRGEDGGVRMAQPVMEQQAVSAAPVVQAQVSTVQASEPPRQYGRRVDDESRFNRDMRGDREDRQELRRQRERTAPVAMGVPVAREHERARFAPAPAPITTAAPPPVVHRAAPPPVIVQRQEAPPQAVQQPQQRPAAAERREERRAAVKDERATARE